MPTATQHKKAMAAVAVAASVLEKQNPHWTGVEMKVRRALAELQLAGRPVTATHNSTWTIYDALVVAGLAIRTSRPGTFVPTPLGFGYVPTVAEKVGARMALQEGRVGGSFSGFDLFEDQDDEPAPAPKPIDLLDKSLGTAPVNHPAERLLKPEGIVLLARPMVSHYVSARSWAVEVKPGTDLQKAGKKLFASLIGKRSLAVSDPFLHDMTLYVCGAEMCLAVEAPKKR